MDEPRRRLKDAAASHRPDRARMLARVERGMASEADAHRRAGSTPWLRIAWTTAAVTGIVAVGGYAVAGVVQQDPPDRTPAAASSPAASERPSQEPRTPQTPDTPDTPQSRQSSSSREEGASPATTHRSGRTEDGPLWSDGSVDPHSNEFWAQSEVTVKTAEPLTSLTVELHIAQTGGVSPTGAWLTLPEQDFTASTGEESGELVFRWTLKEGRTVPAGRHIFAGQYDHARGGRDAGTDSYAATARAEGGEGLRIEGGFAPQEDS